MIDFSLDDYTHMMIDDLRITANDDGLTPAQRKHWQQAEEKQAAREKLQRDKEAKALEDKARSLQEAGRAMDRVNP